MTMKTARDSFLSLTTFALLYVLIGTFLSVAFSLIDYAYPPVLNYLSYRPSVSFGLATLIVVTPILLTLLFLFEQLARREPERVYTRTRKFFTYLTLLFSGGTIIGDCITAVYYLLDGRDFSTAFIAKSLVAVVVAAVLLWYYLSDLKEKTTKVHRIAAAVIIVVLVLAEIFASFAIIGTPATARAYRYDDLRVQALAQIQGEVVSYWQNKGTLPVQLGDIEAGLLGRTLPRDPETAREYEYLPNGINQAPTFQICATFGKPSDEITLRSVYSSGTIEDGWSHQAGRVCFDRTIDPSYYPPIKPIPARF